VNENIVEFPDRSSVQSEAALWLIKLDGDQQPTDEMLASLHEWLSRSPAHREELRNMAVTWSNMNVLTELAVPLAKVEASKRSFSPTGALHSWLSRVANRVIVASVLLLGTAYSLYALWPQRPQYFATNGVYATEVGEQKTVILSDGSAILLNTNSEVVVDYNREFRDIRLARGEVEFTVAKNPDLAFRVYAGNERVQALGTAFTVYMQDNKIDVTVTEGRVTLATLSQPALVNVPAPDVASGALNSAVSPGNASKYVETLSALRAGQSASMNIKGASAENQLSAIETVEVIQEQDLARRLSWREGLLVFAGDPLEDVVREISRYTTVDIEISDPEVRAIKIGGQFRVGETDAMLEALETNFGLLVTRLDENRVVLSSAKNQKATESQ
jgi:transmembrane sensor